MVLFGGDDDACSRPEAISWTLFSFWGGGGGVVSFCSTPFWVMENSDQGIDNKGTLGNGQGGEGFFELG